MAADGNKLIEGAGGGGGGSSQRTPVEAPDSLNSTALAHIVDLVSEGEIVGFYSANILEDVFLDETPVANPDGSLNFQNVQVDSRTGTQAQTYLKGFPSVENEVGIGVELLSATPWVRTVSNTSLSAVRVRLSVAALSRTDMSNGDIHGHTVAYAIDVSTDGGAYVEVLQTAFTGKTSSKYERSHRLDLPDATTSWNIRVRRLTPDNPAGNIQDTTAVESITEIMDLKLRYPNSALVGVKIDAAQFQSIPTRAYRMMGLIVKIPSNYNPITRIYTGVWDGTFALGWTNNPAWIFYDLITAERYGLGEHVDEAMIDKFALYNIAQYCDEEVSDGKGGMEPRFQCTVYYQRQEDAYKVVQDLASAFRGISYWGSGAIIPVADMPRDPVYTYTNANVKDGKFSYSGSGRRARHTVALVSWSDPTDFGRQKVEYVEDQEGIARYGVQTMSVNALGCQSQSQAQRLGRWMLLTERYETDTVTFAVGLDGGVALPGDVIMVADAKRAGKRIAGRVAAATTTAITLDAMPAPPPVPGDTLIVAMPAGHTETRVISTVVGDVVTVPAFSAVPVVGAIWATESEALKTQLFSVISLSEGDGLEAIITGLQHEPGKFEAVDNDTFIEPRVITDIVPPVQLPPTDLEIVAVERAGEVIAAILVTASWTAAANAVSYDVQWRRSNGEWSMAQRVIGTEAELWNPFPGDYVCKVTARNGIGIVSAPLVSSTFQVADQSMYPGFVDALNDAIELALETAENAQATADGAIQSFWQTTAPSIGVAPDFAAVGDLWFDTDDGNKAWRLTGGVWVNASDDDMAQAILAATQAQATADGKVKTYFASTAPVHSPPTVILQLGDLWFNTTVGVKKLFRWNGSNWGDLVSDITMDQLAGLGTNLLPDEYSILDSTTLSDYGKTSFITLSRSTVQKYVGPASLEVLGLSSSEYFYFTPGGASNIRVTPGRKYIISFYVRSAWASAAGSIYLFDGVVHFGNYNFATSPTPNTWTRVSMVADLTSSTSSLLSIRMDPASGVIFFVDGMMIEYQLGTQTFPSPYSRGTGSGLALLALARAATAQATADGATVIYRQSAAPTFPPAAIGDYWIDTDDNSYWYTTNGTTWTAVTDPRIAQALADAAAAQATANGRIKTWFQEATPTAATVGDMWYKASVGILYRWDGSVWVNTADNTQAVANPNVVNGGFEQDFTGWADAVGVGLTGWYTQAPGLTGSKCMVKYGGYNGTQSGMANSAYFPVEAGRTIIARMMARSDSIPDTSNNGVSLGVAFYTQTGAFLDGSSYGSAREMPPSYFGAQWRSFNKAVMVPPTATHARIVFIVWNYAGVGAWSFDSLQAFEAEEVMASSNMLKNADFANGTANWVGLSSALAAPESWRAYPSPSAASSGVSSYTYQDVTVGVTQSIGRKVSASIEGLLTGTLDGNTQFYLTVQCWSAGYAALLAGVNSNVLTNNPTNTWFKKCKVDGLLIPASTAIIRFIVTQRGLFGGCPMRMPKMAIEDMASAWTPSVEMSWGTALGTSGSGVRMGDARNYIQSQVNSFGAVRSTAALTAVHTLGGVKYIDVNAHVAYWGGSSATYNAVGSAATGLTAGQAYVVYCDDPGFGGGTKTWLTSTTPAAQMQLGDGKYVAGVVEVPASGGGSGSGGGGGGGPPDDYCLDYETAMLSDGGYVRNLCVGDIVECWNGDAANPAIEYHQVLNMDIGQEWCYSVMTKSGAWIDQSESTRMVLRDGREVTTLHMTGEEVLLNRDGVLVWEEVTDVIALGLRTVVKMNLGDRMYFARSSERGATIATHNLKF